MNNEFVDLKISDFIEKLLQYKKEHGDLPVVSYILNDEEVHEFSRKAIIEVISLYEGSSEDFSEDREEKSQKCLEISFV